MDNIELFLAQAEKRLRRALPAKQVTAILSEAREHLTARTAEFIGEGMSEDQAAATATANFGQPKEWASTIIQSAYQDDKTEKARIAALFAAGLGLCVPLLLPVGPLEKIIFPLLVLAAIGVIVGSFRARQYLPRFLLMLGILAVAINFLYYGLTSVSVPGYSSIQRSNFNWYLNYWTLVTRDCQQEVDLLRLGQQTYQQSATQSNIPSILRTSSGYIVPVPTSEWKAGTYFVSWTSAFKRSNLSVVQSKQGHTEEELLRLKAQMPYCTVASITEATQAWHKDGSLWLFEQQESLQSSQSQLQSLKQAAARPAGFDYGVGTVYEIMTGILTIFALLLNWSAATLGRRFFRLQAYNRSLLT